jgi:pyruvate/2-oxoglutarate dehydrogenase complex dihydrolipoamide acyltransferase (E2) component
VADRIQINLGVLRELASAHAFLFADTPSIVLKAADDLTALVKLRIAEHEQAEAAKAEALRAQIAEEERVKAEAAERARVAAETKRQLDEQAANLAAARAREEAAARAIAASAAPAPVAKDDVVDADFQEVLTVTPIASARPAPLTIPLLPSLRLGQINERLAPVSLTADGLTRLGFAPAATDKAAKLYHEQDFPAMCAALIRHITAAQQARAA